MQKFMETIIHALKSWLKNDYFHTIKSWVKNDAFTDDDAFEVAEEMTLIQPVRAKDGTIYTAPNGDIYTLN